MDEKLKLRREMIFRVLTWGTVVYFLVMGYSLDKSALFEYQAHDEEVLKDLDRAKEAQATLLISEADKLEASNPGPLPTPTEKPTPTDPVKRDSASVAAKRRVEAAQLRADVYLAKEVRRDGRERAKGLIIGALIYSLIYPIVVWLVYKRTDPGAGITEKDVVPLRAAMAYAIFMSIATCWTAIATAVW